MEQKEIIIMPLDKYTLVEFCFYVVSDGEPLGLNIFQHTVFVYWTTINYKIYY